MAKRVSESGAGSGSDAALRKHKRASCCAFFTALLLEVLAWGLAVVAITTSFWICAPSQAAHAILCPSGASHLTPPQRRLPARCRR